MRSFPPELVGVTTLGVVFPLEYLTCMGLPTTAVAVLG